MSENITHMAVFEDSSRLALHSPHVCTAFKETLNKHWEIARHGSVTVSGDKSTLHLLNFTRSEWKTRRPEDHIDERLAYLLGWRCHLAADRTFKHPPARSRRAPRARGSRAPPPTLQRSRDGG